MVPKRLERPCILVVDDQVELANTLARVLCAEGLRTQVVHDGLAALEYVANAGRSRSPLFVPDAIVCDLNMPRCDGFGLLGALLARAFSGAASIIPPVLLMTGERDDEIQERALALGAAGVLFKPFAMPDFLSAVASLLSGCDDRRHERRRMLGPAAGGSLRRPIPSRLSQRRVGGHGDCHLRGGGPP